MTGKGKRSDDAAPSIDERAALRRQAEAIARQKAARTPEGLEALTPEETRRLVHELQVHQIEVEMQNIELLRVQEELETSRARYVDLYDLAPVGYCVLSEEGLILEANLKAADLLGLARGALVRQPIAKFILKEDQDTYYLYRRHLFETGEPQACELRMTSRDGPPLWIHLEAAAAQAADGAAVWRVVISDVTERRALERQVAHAQNMDIVGQLAGGTAHDFNNLLQVIQACLDLIRHKIDKDEKTEKIVETAMGAVRRGASLTAQLLSFSRQQMLLPQDADPNALIEQAVELLQRTLGEDVEIATVLAADCRSIRIDPHGFANAILNLALNARAGMPKGGRLTIRTADRHLDENEVATETGSLPAGGYVEIALTDSGCGMPPEVMARAFEPFFTTKEVGEGSGLGLSMVYGFVCQSGGHVALESEIGKGTTVRMLFPAVAAKVVARPEPRKKASAEAGVGTVLVVEDDPAVRGSIVMLLEKLGYATLEAANGDAALAVLDRDAAIDLLFTDMVMPGGMSGLDLAREAVRRHRNLKVLLTSGYSKTVLEIAGHMAGDFPLLAKPYSSPALREAIRSALAGRDQA